MEIIVENIILDRSDIEKKIERIAYEIYEHNYSASELIFIGIREGGTELAKRIKKVVADISDLKSIGYRIDLNPENPTEGKIELDKRLKAHELNDKVVIIVDDVANTGRTLCYAIQPLLEALPQKIQVAVLVDREHKLFPIKADYVGIRLSTTLLEHITVSLKKGEEKVTIK